MERRKRVKLPRDRNGTPINVGDWLMFSDGPFHVCTMTYYGDDMETIGAWTAEDDGGDYCDNLKAGLILTYKEDDDA